MRRRSVIGLILGFAVAFGLVASTSPAPPPGFVSAYRWTNEDHAFGGLSAIDLSQDGKTFAAISDRGTFLTGRFLRDADDRIIGVEANPIMPLLSPNGGKFRKNWDDSEGLALLPDQTAYISFERNARVLRYETLGAVPGSLPVPAAFAEMDRNASLETLAVDSLGTLFTLPEESGGLNTAFPVFRFQNGVWDQPFSLPRRGWFLASDADFGPDGRFYLLERQFRGLSGFVNRVRRFELGPKGVTREETLFQTKVGQHDNLEGLSVWRDRAGKLRLSMVSDDNYFFLQRTELVEYSVPD